MRIKFSNIILFLYLLLLALPGRGEAMYAGVYRDDYISVEAGITDLEHKIVHFGDVLELVVNIKGSDKLDVIPELGPEFFSDVWPEAQGAYLLDHNTSVDRISGISHNRFRFQIMSCPDEQILCKGTRNYTIPEFTLSYQVPGSTEDGEEPERIIQFQPWPVTFMVASAIPLGEEGELNPFATYFPTGAYPDPLSGGNDLTSSRLIAGSLFLLLGGILMSPFSFFKGGSSAQKTKTRWEEVLDQLNAGSSGDDAHTLEAIRKCLVWYCLDELDVDPFYWVKHQEELSGKQQKGIGEFEEYRKLFIELLQGPEGQSKNMLERLNGLLK